MKNTIDPIWTQRFRLLYVLIALFGLIMACFTVVVTGSSNFRLEVLPGLLLDGVFLVVYLIGLPIAKGMLLRFALLFQAGSLFLSALTHFLALLDQVNMLQTPSAEANQGLFFLILGRVLGTLSAVCLSYEIVRFQPSDRIFLGVQVFFALGLTWGGARASGLLPPLPGFGAEMVLLFLLLGFLGAAGFASLAFRPACWKAQPIITTFLAAGGIFSLFIETGVLAFLPAALLTKLDNGTNLMSTTLFLIGVLLLIQTRRLDQATGREQVSPVPPAID